MRRSKAATGKYYAGPTWEAADGSKITGKQVAVAPASAGNIPFQLVKTEPGSGALKDVTYIQRVNTKGGVAPSDACNAVDEGHEKDRALLRRLRVLQGGIGNKNLRADQARPRVARPRPTSLDGVGLVRRRDRSAERSAPAARPSSDRSRRRPSRPAAAAGRRPAADRDHHASAARELLTSGSGIEGAAAVTMMRSNGARSGHPS